MLQSFDLTEQKLEQNTNALFLPRPIIDRIKWRQINENKMTCMTIIMTLWSDLVLWLFYVLHELGKLLGRPVISSKKVRMIRESGAKTANDEKSVIVRRSESGSSQGLSK